jgi:LPS O-antigen subunit length determinant protein (WzzB/FepE family)
LIVNEVNNEFRTRHLRESTIALGYLKNELASTSQREVQQSISQLIEAQLKIQMLANIRKDYIIRAIDPGFLPEEKSAPRKTRMVALGTMIGLILSIFASIIRQTYFSHKLKKSS